jgi:hypothetical protein
MSLCDLALFTSRSGLCRRRCFGATRRFYSFGGSGTRCLLGLTEILLQGNFGRCSLMGTCCVCRLACSSFGSLCGRLGFGLGQQSLLTNLFGSAVTQLCAILSPRG